LSVEAQGRGDGPTVWSRRSCRKISFCLRIGVLCLALGIAAPGADRAAAAGGPTGDAATIAFYRAAQGAYRNVPAVIENRTGYLSYTSEGSVPRWQYGLRPTAGFTAASESLLVLLSGGVITKYVDTARAPGHAPLSIIEDSSGVWSMAAGKCYFANPRASGVGGWAGQLIGVVGNFAPMRRSGDVVTITSTYPWGKSGTATEIDRISATTKQFISSEIKVMTAAPFTFTITFREVLKPATVAAPEPHC